MKRRVYLYAFDVETMRVTDVKFLDRDAITIDNIRKLAKWMNGSYSSTTKIYAIDNRRDLYREFLEAVKSNDFSKYIDFVDIVDREGILIKV